MAQNLVINGVTYNGVDSLTIPKSGGGKAEYVDASTAATNTKTYEITLTKASGWVLLTTLDDEVAAHMSDTTLTVSLVNISPYAYEYFAGDIYMVGNKPIGYTNTYPFYGYSNRENSETSAITQPIYYPANYTGTSTGIGGYGIFRLDGSKYYIQPSNGFIKAGKYRLTFAW